MRRMTNFWAFIKKLASLIGFTGDKIEVGNDLEVDGKIKCIENIVDIDNNERFKNIPLTPNTIENITWGYTSATLNGKELNIYLRGVVSAGATIPSNTELIRISKNSLDWIWDKIMINTTVSSTYVMSSGLSLHKGNSVDFVDCSLNKNSPNLIIKNSANIVSASNKTYFNLELHLNID